MGTTKPAAPLPRSRSAPPTARPAVARMSVTKTKSAAAIPPVAIRIRSALTAAAARRTCDNRLGPSLFLSLRPERLRRRPIWDGNEWRGVLPSCGPTCCGNTTCCGPSQHCVKKPLFGVEHLMARAEDKLVPIAGPVSLVRVACTFGGTAEVFRQPPARSPLVRRGLGERRAA